MKELVDYHIHTRASDGIYSIGEIIEQARVAGLSSISITDHDTVSAYDELVHSPLPTDLEIVPGIEFSSEYKDSEVHILGYFLDVNSLELRTLLKERTERRLNRLQQMIEKIVQLGYELSWEEVQATSPMAASYGRPHIAAALVAKKYFSSIHEVFYTLLCQGGPAYLPHKKLTPREVLAIIRQTGGVSVLAHPGLLSHSELLPEIIELGIKGLEVYHPAHKNCQCQAYLELAKKHNLYISGGSDFHGTPGRSPFQLGDFPILKSQINLKKSSK